MFVKSFVKKITKKNLPFCMLCYLPWHDHFMNSIIYMLAVQEHLSEHLNVSFLHSISSSMIH
ncbi:hypothetical protein Fmac_020818 [Flemingia macrophylla]|uniref:Maturase K n=1 Tax=Flemingia macrophylla TaxID=520843 RepID=A0ABD1LV48_9FABA